MRILKENINRFLKDKGNNDVLILKGEWGSGKTYLIDEILKEKYQGDVSKISKISFLSKKWDDILKELFSDDYNFLTDLTKLVAWNGISLSGAGNGIGLTRPDKKRYSNKKI